MRVMATNLASGQGSLQGRAFNSFMHFHLPDRETLQYVHHYLRFCLGQLLTDKSYTIFIVLHIYEEALDRLRVRLNMYLVS